MNWKKKIQERSIVEDDDIDILVGDVFAMQKYKRIKTQ